MTPLWWGIAGAVIVMGLLFLGRHMIDLATRKPDDDDMEKDDL